MIRYAIVNTVTSRVNNIVEYETEIDTEAPPAYPEAYVAVLAGDSTVGPGWIYQDGKFIEPDVIEPHHATHNPFV